jgi:hypothetical protein
LLLANLLVFWFLAPARMRTRLLMRLAPVLAFAIAAAQVLVGRPALANGPGVCADGPVFSGLVD